MKRIIFSSALLILLVGLSSLAPATKYKYKAEEAKLSVTFPAEFTTDQQVEENYKSVKAQAISDEMIFIVIYSVHESDVSDESDELTKVSIDAFMEGLGASSKGNTTWKVKKHSGLKANYEVADKDLVGDYRVVMIGNIQYQITAVAEKKYWDDTKAKKFFKSFKVKK